MPAAKTPQPHQHPAGRTQHQIGQIEFPKTSLKGDSPLFLLYPLQSKCTQFPGVNRLQPGVTTANICKVFMAFSYLLAIRQVETSPAKQEQRRLHKGHCSMACKREKASHPHRHNFCTVFPEKYGTI